MCPFPPNYNPISVSNELSIAPANEDDGSKGCVQVKALQQMIPGIRSPRVREKKNRHRLRIASSCWAIFDMIYIADEMGNLEMRTRLALKGE